MGEVVHQIADGCGWVTQLIGGCLTWCNGSVLFLIRVVGVVLVEIRVRGEVLLRVKLDQHVVYLPLLLLVHPAVHLIAQLGRIPAAPLALLVLVVLQCSCS